MYDPKYIVDTAIIVVTQEYPTEYSIYLAT